MLGMEGSTSVRVRLRMAKAPLSRAWKVETARSSFLASLCNRELLTSGVEAVLKALGLLGADVSMLVAAATASGSATTANVDDKGVVLGSLKTDVELRPEAGAVLGRRRDSIMAALSVSE